MSGASLARTAMSGYGDETDFDEWLTLNGFSLPDDAPDPAILLQRASDYIDGTYETRFLGVRTDPLNQERAWPRTGAVVQSVAVPSDLVPPAIERAAYAAAWHEANNPGSLSVASSQARSIKRQKVDVIEKEFFEGSGDVIADNTIRLSSVEGLLAPFLHPLNAAARLGLWAIG